MPPCPRRRLRARRAADPGPPLARADRHPLPARPARRPHRPAVGADPPHPRSTAHRPPAPWATGLRTRRHRNRSCTSTPRATAPPGTSTLLPPGGVAAIYRGLVADDARTGQITEDVVAALARGRHCLVLTQWTA